MRVLGLESSCDDTAAAIVSADRRIHASAVWGQGTLHAPYGGVVPEIAARAHAERLDRVTEAALAEAGLGLADIDLVAVTAGPGLIGGLFAGVVFARALAAAGGMPLVGVNHLAGHALTPRLTDGAAYPYLNLLVSGGHCQLLAVLAPDRFLRLGGTIDDAPGEAFDKVARLMGLGFPGGPAVEAAAKAGDPAHFPLPRPLLTKPGCALSFSGLKTAVRRHIEAEIAAKGTLSETASADLAAGFQAAVAEVLAAKSARAIEAFGAAVGQPPTALAVTGGVAANGTLRQALLDVARAAGLPLLAPPPALCTDNGAMIAWAGWETRQGASNDALRPRPRWPLDGGAEPMLGAGKKGPKA